MQRNYLGSIPRRVCVDLGSIHDRSVVGFGLVLGWFNLTGLLSKAEQRNADVLNGIAYDLQNNRLFVTGKLWPKLFQIRLNSEAKEN